MSKTLLALALTTLSAALPASAGETAYRAEIRRTQYGIPHVKAKDYAGLGYGLGYAFAQDDFCLLADRIVTVNGERAKYFGPDGTTVISFNDIPNVESDFFFKSQIDVEALRKAASRLPKSASETSRGYAAGYNRYLRETGVDALPEACRGAAWVRPMTAEDQLRLAEDKMIQAGAAAFLRGVTAAAPPGVTKKMGAVDPPRLDRIDIGSNGWAFGRDVTRNRMGVLLGNPHYPWETVNRFYEAHLTIPGELDVMGAVTAGAGGVVIGFNKDVAWTHTISTDRHFTLFELALDPHDPTVYLVDGMRHPMKTKSVTIEIARNGAIETETRMFYASDVGPILINPQAGLDWSAAHAYTIRDANAGNFRSTAAWMRIDGAHSVDEIRRIIVETQGMPYVNTIAADRKGNVLYADVTATPFVTAAKLESCAPSAKAAALAKAARIYVLDGSKSACDWDKGDGVEGLMPGRLMPQLQRSDYVANSNDSYWLANPAQPIAAKDPIVGPTAVPQNLRTRAGLIEIERRLKGEDGLPGDKLGPDDVLAMIFRDRNFAADLILDDLLAVCGTADEACAVLAKWDRRMNLDSRGAHLFQEVWQRAVKIKDLYAVPFDPKDPIHTPRGLKRSEETDAAIRKAIAESVATIKEAGLAIDAPLGAVQFALRGSDRIPIHGGDGLDGVLNMQQTKLVKSVGYLPVHGSSYMQIVTFDAAGPVAEAVLSYSQSLDPRSPHFADQTRLYSGKKMVHLPFHEREIAADPELSVAVIAE